jgi:hypothetical protein
VLAGCAIPSGAVLLFLVLIPAMGMRSGPDETRVSLQSRATHLAWLEARLEAAGSTQPSLSIDLTDTTQTGAGTVVLSMSGVPVRTMHAERSHIDGLAQVPVAAPGDAFQLLAFHSDIPHVPVREVIAPSDTVEAAKRPPPEVPVPDVPDYAVLQYDGLEVRLVTGGLQGLDYLLDTLPARLGQRGATSVLRLELPAEDIRAIFRSLEEGSILALRLPQEHAAGDQGQLESSR